MIDSNIIHSRGTPATWLA